MRLTDSLVIGELLLASLRSLSLAQSTSGSTTSGGLPEATLSAEDRVAYLLEEVLQATAAEADDSNGDVSDGAVVHGRVDDLASSDNLCTLTRSGTTGQKYYVVGKYNTGYDRYWSVCWDSGEGTILEPDARDNQLDEDWLLEAVDLLAYWTVYDHTGTPDLWQSAVEDRSPNISAAHVSGSYPYSIHPQDAQDMIQGMKWAVSEEGRSLVHPYWDFERFPTVPTYGVTFSSVTLEDMNYRDTGTQIRFCETDINCSGYAYTGEIDTFRPENAALDNTTYGFGTCDATVLQVWSEDDTSTSVVASFINDANGFSVNWPSKYYLPLTADVAVEQTDTSLSSFPIITGGDSPTEDNPTLHYSGQTVDMPCSPLDNIPNYRLCSVSFDCPEPQANDDNGFRHGTCTLFMTQENQTATQGDTDTRIAPPPPATADLYSVTATIQDRGGDSRAYSGSTVAGDSNPLILMDDLPQEFRIIPEQQGDYVQFYFGDLDFTNTDVGYPGCVTSEWEPEEEFPGYPARGIRCYFDC